MEIGGLEATEEHFVLAPLPPGGRVGGQIESRTGAADFSALVFLDAQEPNLPDDMAIVEWDGEEGARVGSFRFEDVPQGRYSLRVWTPGDLV